MLLAHMIIYLKFHLQMGSLRILAFPFPYGKYKEDSKEVPSLRTVHKDGICSHRNGMAAHILMTFALWVVSGIIKRFGMWNIQTQLFVHFMEAADIATQSGRGVLGFAVPDKFIYFHTSGQSL